MTKYTSLMTTDERSVPIALIEILYPPKSKWSIEEFHKMVDDHIALLKSKYSDYDRSMVFGNNPYYRYFKKYKKTYPVLQQLESIILKDREFPKYNPVLEIPFLAELETQHLMGSHDIDRIEGTLQFYFADDKTDFTGMRGEAVHTYPGDVTAKDDTGIILSMIAGADERTFVREDTIHVVHPIFGLEGMLSDELAQYMDVLEGYAHILSPEAVVQKYIL